MTPGGPPSARQWKVGDRVMVSPTGREADWTAATVTGVDDGPRPGLSLHLDRRIETVETCYATHSEVRPLDGAP